MNEDALNKAIEEKLSRTKEKLKEHRIDVDLTIHRLLLFILLVLLLGTLFEHPGLFHGVW